MFLLLSWTEVVAVTTLGEGLLKLGTVVGKFTLPLIPELGGGPDLLAFAGISRLRVSKTPTTQFNHILYRFTTQQQCYFWPFNCTTCAHHTKPCIFISGKNDESLTQFTLQYARPHQEWSIQRRSGECPWSPPQLGDLANGWPQPCCAETTHTCRWEKANVRVRLLLFITPSFQL